MKAFGLHVQPEGTQGKEDIEQAVNRSGSSDMFRGQIGRARVGKECVR